MVSRWVKRYKGTGDVKDELRGGRPRIVSAAAAAAAFDHMLGPNKCTASQAAQQLCITKLTSQQVQKMTLIRAIKRHSNGLGVKIRVARGAPRKRLTIATMTKRLSFAKENLRRSWTSVMFSDRKRFMFKYPGCQVKPVVWVRHNERHEATHSTRPQSVNVYCGVTVFGMTRPHCVAGTSKHTSQYVNKSGHKSRNITSDEYGDVLRHTLLPEGRRLFGNHGITQWVFQQDNDPTHKGASAVVEKWSKPQSTSVSVLAKWPPNSPDLNVIENVWSLVQRKVDAMGCNTFEEFKAAVISEVQAVPVKVLRNLFDSMPKRVKEVVRLAGNKTKY